VATPPTGYVTTLASDGTNVYFTTNGSPSFVGYAPGAGGTPVQLAPSTAPTSIVTAGGMVFWIDGTTTYGIGAP
jgi:hypothetical protein